MMESTENSQRSPPKSLEGEIVTGRDLPAYERMLGFDAELLRDKTVLNFGPGLSHLEQQLGEKGITSTVVNLDVIKEPLISTHDVVRYGATMTLDLYARLLEKFGSDTTKVHEFQKTFVGVKDKTFVQYNGRKIPFEDQSFDYILALSSTHQIPPEHREQVFGELLRVGKHIHIGPIGKVDFHVLTRLAESQGFDVVACKSFDVMLVKGAFRKGLRMKTPADYEAYISSRPASERITPPLIDDLTFTMPGINIRMLHPMPGGSSIILKKRSELSMGEAIGNDAYVGVGKPDGLPAANKVGEPFEKARGEAPLDKARGETHPAVGAVKKTVAAWWERVGPGSVEKSWVAAHKNILMQIKETEKRAVFEKTAEIWRKVGKTLGIASTVVDFGLSGVGLVFTGYDIHHWINNSDTRLVRKLITAGIGGTSAGIGILGGPTHLGTRLLAKEVELAGTIVTKAENYVGTGKAAEHAEAVGEVLDKGFKVIAKNPAIVPEKYRKTVEIIAEASEKEEQARKAEELQRRIQEKANFQREHQAWMDDMDPGLQSYYKLRGEWPPSTDEFAKARAGFQKDKAKQEEMAREKRG